MTPEMAIKRPVFTDFWAFVQVQPRTLSYLRTQPDPILPRRACRYANGSANLFRADSSRHTHSESTPHGLRFRWRTRQGGLLSTEVARCR